MRFSSGGAWVIRKRRLFPALLVAGLAASSLLLGYRGDNGEAAPQLELSGNYFFRNARVALTGGDGLASMRIEAGSARRDLEDSALKLEDVSIRRGNPPALSLVADSAILPNKSADLSAQGNLRLAFGPSGTWMAKAEHARMQTNGTRVTLTGQVSFSRAGGPGGSPSISGEHLVLDAEDMTARTDRPVRVRIGDVVFEANGLNAQVAAETITLDSDVQATINP